MYNSETAINIQSTYILLIRDSRSCEQLHAHNKTLLAQKGASENRIPFLPVIFDTQINMPRARAIYIDGIHIY